MNQTPFIVGAYVAFGLFLLLDAALPWLRRRSLMHNLLTRARRVEKRKTP
ncbi:MAG: heme exporter protein CcmD [Lysobacterales bacterium CG02_land_8_20_14_3_00_62_12]|nr:MAG: heme exporter protein CcmD [Xanthomonadales bacterium CG02_land_8_20_14_3_00_62_12]PJA42560.1 MAG: heme exporter protein CcmD [Xanthomonadales bacterium CG_4_9_14_3_um_filter_62_6]